LIRKKKANEYSQVDDRPKKTSELDDDFFNLEEFNKWTDKQEELDMMSDREDQDDEFDFDRNLEEEEDSEEEDEAAEATGNNYEKELFEHG
jgi:U3 small nucleolar RNA-associated protein MPP10